MKNNFRKKPIELNMNTYSDHKTHAWQKQAWKQTTAPVLSLKYWLRFLFTPLREKIISRLTLKFEKCWEQSCSRAACAAQTRSSVCFLLGRCFPHSGDATSPWQRRADRGRRNITAPGMRSSAFCAEEEQSFLREWLIPLNPGLSNLSCWEVKRDSCFF